MKILSIETSCDETAAAIVKANLGDKNVKLLSNVVASSLSLHAKTGGIIPEVAAREQLKYIIPVIEQCFKDAKLLSKTSIANGKSSMINIPDIDALAVTYGPGLIGSLLIGVETAKTLAYVWKKPIIPVNHLIGHIYANFISPCYPQCSEGSADSSAKPQNDIKFPAVVLIVSGGHTDLVLMKQHDNIEWLGGTRDDAAGEAFDKIGRLLNLPYPAGPMIEKLAKKGNPKAFNFPRPLLYDKELDFSFSGLKTAVYRTVILSNAKDLDSSPMAQNEINNICASVQQAIIDVLVKKTLDAAKQYNAKSILLGGGVAANDKLREKLKSSIVNNKLSMKFFAPEKFLCTDNAAMIAAAAFFNYHPVDWKDITADPELYFD